MRKYFGIEILRFFTSLSVLFYHYRHFFNPFNSYNEINYELIKLDLPFSNFLNFFFQEGSIGVQVFYSISGFVFAYIYCHVNQNTSAKKFFLNRFSRLYPLHFATLMFVMFLQVISSFHFDSFQIYQFNDIYHFLLNVFFISSWGFESGYSFNGPIWSVSIEILIYVIFFVFLSLIKKYKIYYSLFISILLLFIDKFFDLNNLFLECARLFFSGTLVFFLSENKKIRKLFFLISTILIIISFYKNFKIYLFCPSLLLMFVSLDDYLKSKTIKEIFLKLGNLTYAIYLLHVPFQILIILIFSLLKIPESIFLNEYFFLIFISILIYFSYLSYKYLEKPLNKLFREKFK